MGKERHLSEELLGHFQGGSLHVKPGVLAQTMSESILKSHICYDNSL